MHDYTTGLSIIHSLRFDGYAIIRSTEFKDGWILIFKKMFEKALINKKDKYFFNDEDEEELLGHMNTYML